ncbi:MAG: hypothetical protein KDC98_09785, partial [Planctomycetes bacterium]|nr:hypothetical protein [Planctomycetota bacterium]
MRAFAAAVTFTVAVVEAQQPDWLLDPSPYVARVERDADTGVVILDNGLLALRLSGGGRMALIGLEQRTAGQQLLRAAASLGEFVLDGRTVRLGGLEGQPDHAFLREEWLADMKPIATAWQNTADETGPIRERFAWQRRRHCAPDAVWPPRGRHLAIRFSGPDQALAEVSITVHFELYDGIPMFAHWLELEVGSGRREPVNVDSFTSLRLPIVEAESRVEPQRLGVRLPNIHVETDYAFHAMTGADGSSHCVRWLEDPEFHTQVNYQKQTLCLLEVKPDVGPDITVPPGGRFETFRTFVL